MYKEATTKQKQKTKQKTKNKKQKQKQNKKTNTKQKQKTKNKQKKKSYPELSDRKSRFTSLPVSIVLPIIFYLNISNVRIDEIL